VQLGKYPEVGRRAGIHTRGIRKNTSVIACIKSSNILHNKKWTNRIGDLCAFEQPFEIVGSVYGIDNCGMKRHFPPITNSNINGINDYPELSIGMDGKKKQQEDKKAFHEFHQFGCKFMNLSG